MISILLHSGGPEEIPFGRICPVFQGLDQILATFNRALKFSDNLTNFPDSVGVAAASGFDPVFITPEKRTQILQVAITTIEGFDDGAMPITHHMLLGGAPIALWMSSDANAATAMKSVKHLRRAEPGLDLFGRTENQEVALRRFVFHADDDAKTVRLNPLPKVFADLRGIMIGDTDTVKATLTGHRQEVGNGEVAAGGNFRMDM